MRWIDGNRPYVFKVVKKFSAGMGETMRVYDRHRDHDFESAMSPEIRDLFEPDEYQVYVMGHYCPDDNMIYLSSRKVQEQAFYMSTAYSKVFVHDVEIKEDPQRASSTGYPVFEAAIKWLEDKGKVHDRDFTFDQQGGVTGQTVFSFKNGRLAMLFKLSLE